MVWDMRKIALFGVLLVLCSTLVPYAYASHPIYSESHIHGNILTTIILSDAPVTISDDTPDYEPISETISIGTTEYDCIRIVNTETDGNGIADSEGNVSVQFTINNNRPFCFAIHHLDGENSKLKIDVSIDNETKHYTSNLSGSIIQYIGKDNKYFSLNTLKSNEDWILTSSEISVDIRNYAGHVPESVTLEILFLD